MTDSMGTMTNCTRRSNNSSSNSTDNPIDLVVAPVDPQEHVRDENGLFDSDEDNLTLFDLRSIPICNHDLSIFDELAHQCNAVLLLSNPARPPSSIPTTENKYPSTSDTMTTTSEYEQRFQRSLQKLTIPSWFTDVNLPSKLPSKSSITSAPPISSLSSSSSSTAPRDPDIIHVRRPHSYRSCRSSLTTSPSPSLHSWHPNHFMDGVQLSCLLPASSSSSRRHKKYVKGIERVTKSSQWYQPTQLITADKSHTQTGTLKQQTATVNRQKSPINSHYDVPKSCPMNSYLSNDVEKTSNKSVVHATRLINNIDCNDVENTIGKNKNNNNNDDDKGNSMPANDKLQQNKRTIAGGIETNVMPLVSLKIPFNRVELEEVTDDEEDDSRSTTTNRIRIPSLPTLPLSTDNNVETSSMERVANQLVNSILADVLQITDIERAGRREEEEDTNSGVRELSDDENGLRELDENDISGTDEFIVLAPNTNDNTTISAASRTSLNRLYTFSRSNDDGIGGNTSISSKQTSSIQDYPILMIADENNRTISSPHYHLSDTNEQTSNTMVEIDNNNHRSDSPPIYRSHIQKRCINLGRYYDGMMRGTNSQLPTYDLHSKLTSFKPSPSHQDGINEETVRKGRLLLDSMPISSNENDDNLPWPVRSILKTSRPSDRKYSPIDNDHVIQIDETKTTEQIPSPITTRTTTTVKTTMTTEEYRRTEKRVIEEYEDEVTGEIRPDSGYSSNQERIGVSQPARPSSPVSDPSPYEPLSECYSGYSLTYSDFLTPTKAPLTSLVSSLLSTTDEAYGSEPTTTTSPRSLTTSLSPANTIHVHPNLEHEFEYPSPPPPVPDRRLKPAHLRPAPPPKPRHNKSQTERDPSVGYSTIQKTKPSPRTAIEHLVQTPFASTSNDPTNSARTISSRHFCGSLPPSSNESSPPVPSSSTTTKATMTNERQKRNIKTLSCLGSSAVDDNEQELSLTRSSSNKNKSKKQPSSYFDEATNGLAIRLPAPVSNGHSSIARNKTSTPSSAKRFNGAATNLNSDRFSLYETSV